MSFDCKAAEAACWCDSDVVGVESVADAGAGDYWDLVVG